MTRRTGIFCRGEGVIAGTTPGYLTKILNIWKYCTSVFRKREGYEYAPKNVMNTTVVVPQGASIAVRTKA